MTAGKHLNSAGDTIVEVLMAIAVLSVVLGGAYASIQRSFINSRRAQERSEAIKHVETQLEQLKGLSKNPSNNVFTTSTPFCASSSGIVAWAGTLPALDAHDSSFYPAACRINTIPDGYSMSIVRNGNDFIARARWINANGTGNEEVRIIYRIYP